MRILHVHEVAGQASLISRAQRDLGVKSDVLVFNEHPFNYKYDICLNINKKSSIIRIISSLGINFVKCLFKYDVFHFHFGGSLLPYNIDLPILKLFRKRIIMHYWGSDIRQLDIAVDYTHFNMNELKDIYPNANDDQKRQQIKKINKYVDVSIVGDYSLLPYSPNSIVIKQAIDLKKFDFVGCEAKNKNIKFVHAPSNRKIKGTKYILPVIERLRKEGYNIDFLLIENKTNEEASEIYKEADIVIDQLLGESHGIFAIECMALGKPVLCRINENFIKYYKDLPILSTNPDNLYRNLKLLIENPNLRRELGEKGRKYVEEVHDSKKIAKRLLELYKSL
ncbi:glycosyltransferase [Dehalococcoidia bacterium]|nr:glycosyltransferase [Dehalococcoidia bacterium]